MMKPYFFSISFFLLFSVYSPFSGISHLKGQEKTFAGTWKTNYGKLTIKIKGNKLEGSYRYREKDKKLINGKVEGVISENGKLAKGIWDQGETGSFEFVLSPNGKKFLGKYWYSDKSYGGEWNGTKPDQKRMTTKPGLWI